MSSGTPGRGREHERLRRDVEGPLVAGRVVRPGRAAGAAASGSSSGARTGRPMPKPGIAALPHASVRVVGQDAGRARLGDVGGDLGIVGGQLDADRDVRLGGVAQVAERQRPTDDRDRVAGRQPRLAVAPRRASVRRRRSSGSRSLDAGGPCSSAAIAASRSGSAADDRRARSAGPARPARPPNAPSRSSKHDRRVPPGAAREDPDVAAVVADPEADRALLVEVGPSPCGRRHRHGGAVVHAWSRSGAARPGVTSAGSMTPLMRTSPAAIEAIVDVAGVAEPGRRPVARRSRGPAATARRRMPAMASARVRLARERMSMSASYGARRRAGSVGSGARRVGSTGRRGRCPGSRWRRPDGGHVHAGHELAGQEQRRRSTMRMSAGDDRPAALSITAHSSPTG